MISPETGSIRISQGFAIDPGLCPREIDQSLIIKRDTWDDKEAHRWTILSLHPFSHNLREIHSTLRFCNDTLFSADFAIDDDRFGTSWSEWSEDKELKRKEEHDRLLNEVLGSKREFYWGTVWSVFDRKGACSLFGVNYKKTENKSHHPTTRSRCVGDDLS